MSNKKIKKDIHYTLCLGVVRRSILHKIGHMLVKYDSAHFRSNKTIQTVTISIKIIPVLF